MSSAITIEKEIQNRGSWIKVFVPYPLNQKSSASIQDKQGVVIKQLTLNEGHNAIDISQLKKGFVDIKVETPFETILKEINIT